MNKIVRDKMIEMYGKPDHKGNYKIKCENLDGSFDVWIESEDYVYERTLKEMKNNRLL